MSIFSQNKKTRLKRTMFDLSCERKQSMKFGGIYPTYVNEVIPGDTFQIQTQSLVRFAPLIAPIMHRIDVYHHYFFVPNRIIWDSWEDFITGKLETVVPTFNADTLLQKGRLADYLGLPTYNSIAGGDANVSRLPFYAYNKIWNEYYRDQDLQTEVSENNQDILLRAWTKDYLTSARPFAQKGDAPSLPIISQVTYLPESRAGIWGVGDAGGTLYADGSDAGVIKEDTGEGDEVFIKNIDEINATLTINDLRTTAAIQQYLEKKARGGNRYAEYLLSIFGVKSSDQRLNRPEYLGGGKQNVVISEVLNQAQAQEFDSNDITNPVGSMAGHGISVGKTNRMKKFFNEHGWIMGVMSIMPKPAYQQGIHKMFNRTDLYDFFIPQMANLGEQEVKQREVFWQPGETDNDDVFGYQSMYAEMKYSQDSVAGDFRDDLNFWTLSRIFEEGVLNKPRLNEEFIQCVPDAGRIFAAGDQKDYIWTQIYHKINAVRPMPYFGTPGLTKI